MSQLTTGVSIHFDAQALHDAEEEEYRREEAERQNELRAALLDAFEDDLSDEESDTSRDTHGISLISGDTPGSGPQNSKELLGRDQDPQAPPLPSSDPPPTIAAPPDPHPHPQHGVELTPTPLTDSYTPPPLVPPARQYEGYQDNWGATDANYRDTNYNTNYATNGDNYNPQYPDQRYYDNYGYPVSGGYYGDSGTVRQRPDFERGEIEGANEEDNNYQDSNYQYNVPQQPEGYNDQYQPGGTYNYGYHEQPTVQPPEEHNIPTRDVDGTQPAAYPQTTQPAAYPQTTQQAPQQTVKEPARNTINVLSHHKVDRDSDAYTVQYHRDKPTTGADSSPTHGYHRGPMDATRGPDPTRGSETTRGPDPTQLGPEVDTSPPRPSTAGQAYDDLQQDFRNRGSQQVEQLQILYTARGRKIEELTQNLDGLKDDTDREIRILKHKITLIQDERDGARGSLEQTQALLAEARHRDAELQGTAAALENQILALKGAKEELIQKLESAESQVEGLMAQLMSLEASETLTRARSQHDAIVAGLSQKHAQEVYSLKEKLDVAQRIAENRDSELGGLKKQIISLQKSSENAQIDRAETINRLTRSLEDSQRHCQELVEAGHTQELSRMKIHLQEVIAGKSIAEDLNSALQAEMKELREQVTMYESASQYGIFSTSSGATKLAGPAAAAAGGAGTMDDSYHQLGIRGGQNAVWNSLENTGTDTTLTNEGTLLGLKSELERCLHMYKNKREQQAQLQESLRTAKASAEQHRAQAERAIQEATQTKLELSSLQEKLGDGIHSDNPREVMLGRELAKVTRERDALDTEVTDVKKRLDETVTNEEEVSALNHELMARMAQMVQEYDDDKKTALEKCQESVLKHHDLTTERLRAELEQSFTDQKRALEEQWEASLTQHRDQLRSLQDELDEVKSSYVSVCQEKDDIADTVRRECDHRTEQLQRELKETFEKEKEAAVQEAHSLSSTKLAESLAEEREKWAIEQEEDMKRKIEEEIARSRAELLAEQQTVQAESVERAVERVRVDTDALWQQRWDAQEIQRGQAPSDPTVDQPDLEKQYSEKLSALETTHTERVSALESSHTERVASIEQRSADQLAALEREHAEKIASLEAEWKEKLEQTRNESIAEKHSELEEALTTARRQWEMNNALDEAKLRKTMEDTARELKQELESLRAEQTSLATDHERQRAAWESDLALALRQKDAERRQALVEVQETSGAEYRAFLAEHQDTLTRALTAAKEAHRQEKEVMENQYKEQIEALKKAPNKMAELQKSLQNERAEIESEWSAKLESVIAAHEEDVDAMMAGHRDNLGQALEEARRRWQEKLESALEQNERTVLLAREREWETERLEYLSEIHERDQILQNADAHMETELSRLHDEMERRKEAELEEELHKIQTNQTSHEECEERLHESTARLKDFETAVMSQHQQELHKLREEHDEDLAALQQELNLQHEQKYQELTQQHEQLLHLKLKELETVLESRYESQVQDLRQEMDRDFLEKFNVQREEIQRVLSKLEESRKQLKDLYTKYTKDTKNLARKVEHLDQEYKKAKQQLEECESRLSETDNQRTELADKVDSLERELEKAERQRQNAVDSMKQAVQEHENLASNMETRNKELMEKFDRAEKQLKMVKAEAQHQLLVLQDSLEREQTTSVDNLKVKIVEMNQKHVTAIEKLKADHKKETEQLLREQAVKQDERAIQDMRDQYLEAVEKIREDVVKHMSQTNEKAAADLKIQVMRERQLTARRLRKYYMKCLAHMFDKEYDPVTKQQKLSAMERYLEHVPERESSRSSTPSVQSADSSKSTTPVTELLAQDTDEERPQQDTRQDTRQDAEGFKVPAPVYSRSNSTSSSRPTSASSDRRKKPAIQSQMTYPAPTLKTGRPPPGVSVRRPVESSAPQRSYSRVKSQENEGFRQPLDGSLDVALSVSTPDLSPRQVAFTDREDVQTPTPGYTDPGYHNGPGYNNHNGPSYNNHNASFTNEQDFRPLRPDVRSDLNSSQLSEAGPSARKYTTMAYRETTTPVDDIMRKYSGADDPSYHSLPRARSRGTDQSAARRAGLGAKYSLSRSTENINLSASAHDTSLTSSGYKYTPLRNILGSKAQSKSSTHLHLLSSEPVTLTMHGNIEIDSVEQQQTQPQQPKSQTPPEKLPAKPREGSTPPRLSLNTSVQNIDFTDSETTPRTDGEVAAYTRQPRSRRRPESVPSYAHLGDGYQGHNHGNHGSRGAVRETEQGDVLRRPVPRYSQSQGDHV